MHKRIKIFTALLFVIVLIMPVIQKQYAIMQYEPVDEKRLKHEPPIFSMNNIIGNHSRFKRQYELYYEDSYGLRDFFIQLKHQIDYSVFKKTDRVFIGKYNWLFSKWICEKQINNEREVDEVFTRACKNTQKLVTYLNKKDIKLIVVTTPNKNTVYPEYMTNEMPKRPDVTVFNRYRKFLDDHNDIVHIDATKMLFDLKKEYRVFHKTDFHWNRVAEYFVARRLVNTISKMEGLGIIWDDTAPEVVEKEIVGGQVYEIPMLHKPKEVTFTVKIDELKRKEWKKRGGIDSQGIFADIFTQRKKYDKKFLPTSVFFPDSFMMEFCDYGGHIYFKKFYRVNKMLRITLYDILKNLPDNCEYFILQRMEADIFDIMSKKDFYVPDNV